MVSQGQADPSTSFPIAQQPQTHFMSGSAFGGVVVGQTQSIPDRQATWIGNDVIYQYPSSVSQFVAKEPQAHTMSVIGQQCPSMPQSLTKEPQANVVSGISQQYPSVTKEPQAQALGNAVIGQQYPSVTKEPQAHAIGNAVIGKQYPSVTKEPQAHAIGNAVIGKQYPSMPQSLTKDPQAKVTSGNTVISYEAYRYHSTSLPVTEEPHAHTTMTGESFGGATEQTPTQFPSAFTNYAPQVSVVEALELFPDIPVHNPTGMYNEMGYKSTHQTSTAKAKDARGPGDEFATQSKAALVDYAELEAAYPPPVNTSIPGFSFTETNKLSKLLTPAVGDENKVTSPPQKKLNTRRSLSQRAKFLRSRLVNYSDTSESEAATSKTELTSARKMLNTIDHQEEAPIDANLDTKCAKVSSNNDRLSSLISDYYYSGSQSSSELELVNTKSHQVSVDEEELENSNDKPAKILEKDARTGCGVSHIIQYSNDESSPVNSPTSIKSYLATNGTSYSRLLSGSNTSECSIDMEQSFNGSMAEIISVTDNFLSYMSSLGASSDDTTKPLGESVITEPAASSSNPESQTTFYSHDTHSSYVSTGMCPATHSIPTDKVRSTSILPQKLKVEDEARPGTDTTYTTEPTLPPTETEGASGNSLPPGEAEVAHDQSTQPKLKLVPTETEGVCGKTLPKLKLPPSEIEGAYENIPLQLKLLVPLKREGTGLKRNHRILPPKLKLVVTENKAKGSKHAGEKKIPPKTLTKPSSAGVPSSKDGVPSGKVSRQASALAEAASDGGVEVKSDGVSTPMSAVSTEDGSVSRDVASPSGVSGSERAGFMKSGPIS